MLYDVYRGKIVEFVTQRQGELLSDRKEQQFFCGFFHLTCVWQFIESTTLYPWLLGWGVLGNLDSGATRVSACTSCQFGSYSSGVGENNIFLICISL